MNSLRNSKGDFRDLKFVPRNPVSRLFHSKTPKALLVGAKENPIGEMKEFYIMIMKNFIPT
ncbi:MAG: hypothetical protein CME70_03025 [Halobacteriovorax sp.]|nr:hypothetical protein [Halobacteriovorax sp.]